MGDSGRIEECSTSTMVLFGKEFENFHDDNFDGSLNEHQIFTEVLFGNNDSSSSKRFHVNGVSNFESDHAKQTDLSFGSNSETSALTSQVECYNAVGVSVEKPGVGHLAEDLTTSTKSDHVLDFSPLNFPVKDLLDDKPYTGKASDTFASSRGVSCTSHQSSEFDRQVKCHLVESSNQVVISSGYLLKHNIKWDGVSELDEKDIPKYRVVDSDENDQKEMVLSNAIASPVSQESCATKLLVNPSITTTTKSGTLRPPKPKWRDSCFVELDETELAMVRDSKNDPRPLLRYHIHQLLRAAGWVIGRRKRSSKFNGIGEYVFKSPEGRPIREFRRAWISCGEHLLFYANNVVQKNDCKLWTDMNQFLSDLTSTVSEIEEQLGNMEPIAALMHTWCLLDPFANVVFIDKTIRLLKKGKVLKAKRSLILNSLPPDCNKNNTSFISNETLGVPEEDQGTNKDQSDEGKLLNFGPSHRGINKQMEHIVPQDSVSEAAGKGRQKCASKASSQDKSSLPACRSHNSIYDQSSANLFEVPLSLENAHTSLGGSETGIHDVPLAFNEVSKGKSHKNSKRKSETTLTSLYQHNKFGLSTSQNAEMYDISGDGDQQMSHYSSERRSNLKQKRYGVHRESANKKSKRCLLQDDDLLISAILKNKAFKSTSKQPICKSKPLRKRKSKKGSCRLLLRSLNKGGKQVIEGKWSAFGSRTILSWLIYSGVVSLNEVIQYRDPKDYCLVKDGLITWEGVQCKCCDKLLSVSEFKSHAGFRLNRPCLNLFTESGKPFTLCQLEAWSAEYKARKGAPRTVRVEEIDQNDDSCGRCGDGGELICCDNCPSTFHQACLYTKELPEGSWYCPRCICRVCGSVVNEKEDSESSSGLECSQCEKKYHEACVGEKVTKSSTISDTWFCAESCREIYSGLYSRIGLMNILPDGYSWTLLRCIHGDQRVHTAQRFVALKAECNSKLAVAITIMEECFLPMVDPRTGIDMIPHVVYNWGSQFARLNYHGFYTVVLEKDDILISVASIRIHGVTVAEMPLIATCSKYRRQGMCRRIMNSIEEMLKSLKVEKLVISAIPGVVETWTVGFGFSPLEDAEKQKLSDINLMVFPGTVWLKKSLYDNKGQCGSTSDDQLSKLSYEEQHSPSQEKKPEYNHLQVSEGRGASSSGDQPLNLSSAESYLSSENVVASEGKISNTSNNELLKSSLDEQDPHELGCNLDSLELYDVKMICLDEESNNLCIARD